MLPRLKSTSKDATDVETIFIQNKSFTKEKSDRNTDIFPWRLVVHYKNDYRHIACRALKDILLTSWGTKQTKYGDLDSLFSRCLKVNLVISKQYQL